MNKASQPDDQHPAEAPEVASTLWCLHILGADDVHAAPSRAHAEKAAERFNASGCHDPEVNLRAVAAPWPHSAESHAEDVDKFISEWLLPAWQVDAVEPAPEVEALRARVSELESALAQRSGEADELEQCSNLRNMQRIDAELIIVRVRALADRWMRLAEEHGPRQFTGNDHALFANELRAATEGRNG